MGLVGGVAVDVVGQGPPILLLHGFPETRAMWRPVAARLADHFTLVAADLPGYGESRCPPADEEHRPYDKRSMATTLRATMAAFGFDRFAVAGHDRGGRAAYRLALDHPDAVSALGVIDVLPAETAWRLADDRFALGFWPWSLLAQPAPLPERLIGAAPGAVIDAALDGGWGTPAAAFAPSAREAYLAQLADPARLHAFCEEYRAGAGIDREHDRADRAARRSIRCPVTVLWSADGPLGTWYDARGGPLALWREWAPDAEGGGHFLPEELPDEVAARLAALVARA